MRSFANSQFLAAAVVLPTPAMPAASMQTSSPASCCQTVKLRGRPVGVTVGLDGSLLVIDDGSNSVWRIRNTGK